MLAIITLVLCKNYYRKKQCFMDNFVSWITQNNLTAAVYSRGCDCKLIGQVYADRSETVTGSNSLTRNILSNNLCQGSWSPDRISRGIQSPRIEFPGEFNPPGKSIPQIEFPGEFNPPRSDFLGNSIPPDRIFARTKFPVTDLWLWSSFVCYSSYNFEYHSLII